MLALILSIFFSVGHLDTIRMESADSVPLYMTVYTPPEYSPDSVYPVLYLLHGIHGNQYVWEEKAHIRHLCDSLIDNQLIRPLIVVMPLCVVHDSTYASHLPSYCRAMHDYLHHSKKGELEAYFPEIESYIKNHYAILSPSKEERGGSAIAGLSAGAMQALKINIDGRFSIVGLFSPVVTIHDFPKEDIGSFYWIRGGGRDIFYPRARKANRALNRRLVPHNFQRTQGRHNWKAWRCYIKDFLLFAFPAI